MRFGLIEPGSVEVALHGAAIAALTEKGRKNARTRSALVLEAIDIEIRGLGKRHGGRAGPIHSAVRGDLVHHVPII